MTRIQTARDQVMSALAGRQAIVLCDTDDTVTIQTRSILGTSRVIHLLECWESWSGYLECHCVKRVFSDGSYTKNDFDPSDSASVLSAIDWL